MSWLYSQALVVEYLGENCSDGEPFAQLNVMPTPHKFWRNDKTMEFLKLSQFGLTLRLLTDTLGEDVLTLFLAAFPVKTLVSQATGRVSMESEAAYGNNLHESFAKFDQSTSLWRTPQLSLLGESTPYSETWPRWGSMENGECWEQTTLVLGTEESESGSWPTPRACSAMAANLTEKMASHPHNNLEVAVARTIWPTPQARDFRSGSASRISDPNRQNNLNDAVKMWPTPVAGDSKDRGNLSNPCIKRRVEIGKQVGLQMCVSEESGQLNPQWVEWLMGWPIGWTELKPLEMDKFQEWQVQHSLILPETLNKAA